MAEVGGAEIRLRAVEERDAEVIARLGTEEEAGPYDWFGVPEVEPGDGATVDRMVIELLDEDGGPVVVGNMSWHAVAYGPNEGSRALNFGIRVLREYRGQGIGSRAQQMLADHLFATTEVHRVEASTDLENVGEQRALERAGFTREGIARGAQFRGGEHRDMLWGREKLAEDLGVEDTGNGWGGTSLAHNVASPEEVDEIVALAERAGATVSRAPAPTFYGGCAGSFLDLDGHAWEIAHNPGFPLLADGSVAMGEGG